MTAERRQRIMGRTRIIAAVCASVLVLASMPQCCAFAPANSQNSVIRSATVRSRGDVALYVVPPDASWASTLTTAVDFFDGSGVDPVVVSNSFMARLQGQFISVLIGNFLAATVFAFIMSQASSQLSKLGSFVTESIFKGKKGFSSSRASTTFQRA